MRYLCEALEDIFIPEVPISKALNIRPVIKKGDIIEILRKYDRDPMTKVPKHLLYLGGVFCVNTNGAGEEEIEQFQNMYGLGTRILIKPKLLKPIAIIEGELAALSSDKKEHLEDLWSRFSYEGN